MEMLVFSVAISLIIMKLALMGQWKKLKILNPVPGMDEDENRRDNSIRPTASHQGDA